MSQIPENSTKTDALRITRDAKPFQFPSHSSFDLLSGRSIHPTAQVRYYF